MGRKIGSISAAAVIVLGGAASVISAPAIASTAAERPHHTQIFSTYQVADGGQGSSIFYHA